MSSGETHRLDLLPPKQAAALLNVQPATLLEWRREQKGPPFLRMVGRIYYARADLDAWLEAIRVRPS